MSYYQGDYYAGDPGFGSFFKKALGVGLGFVPGVGGIAGKILGAAKTLTGGRSAPALVGEVVGPIAARGTIRTGVGRTVGGIVGTVVKHPVLSAAGAAGVIGAMGGAAAGRRPGRGAMTVAGRRHRRMRVTNPKALRRAIRRTTGFAKLAMRTIHLIHPKKKVRFGGFRRRRARK